MVSYAYWQTLSSNGTMVEGKTTFESVEPFPFVLFGKARQARPGPVISKRASTTGFWDHEVNPEIEWYSGVQILVTQGGIAHLLWSRHVSLPAVACMSPR